MNNAKSFVASLVGFSFTFKPIEKGKDRPVQTIHIGEEVDIPVSTGESVAGFNCRIIFTAKGRGTIQRESAISAARIMEYLAQAANDATEYEEVVYDGSAKEAAETAKAAAKAAKEKEKADKAEAAAKAKAEKAAAKAKDAEPAKAKVVKGKGKKQVEVDPDTVNDVAPDEDFGDPFGDDAEEFPTDGDDF